MKYILYMAITANGMIADKNDNTPWSKEEVASYAHIVKKLGNMIIGRRTYELFLEEDTESFLKLENPVVIILSKTKQKVVNPNPKHYFVRTIAEAEKILDEQGFEEALVSGGSQINSLFIEKVDEVYFDVEPYIFAGGVSLIKNKKLNREMKLIETKSLGKDGVQLHYQVN